MKGEIDKRGFLWFEKFGVFRTHECVNCGNRRVHCNADCIAFREPRKKGGYRHKSEERLKDLEDLFPNIDHRGMLANEKAESEKVVLQLCQQVGVLEFDEFKDERGNGEE